MFKMSMQIFRNNVNDLDRFEVGEAYVVEYDWI
jgi:hypothetical protein